MLAVLSFQSSSLELAALQPEFDSLAAWIGSLTAWVWSIKMLQSIVNSK